MYGSNSAHTETDTGTHTSTDSKSRIQLNSIREAACRFLQLLESTDLPLFTECVRHSPLSHRLVQNMCSKVRATPDKREQGNRQGDVHEDRLGGRQGRPQSGEGVGQDGEEGAHTAFAAQADLLCVVLRADTTRQQHDPSSSSSPSAASLSLPSFSTSLSPPQCFADALLSVCPQAPSQLLAALSDTLMSLTRMLNMQPEPAESRQLSAQVTHLPYLLFFFCNTLPSFIRSLLRKQFSAPELLVTPLTTPSSPSLLGVCLTLIHALPSLCTPHFCLALVECSDE